jgi:hypothetical protein
MTENNPFLPKSLASLTQQKPLLGVPPSPFGQQAQSILSAQTGKEKAPTAFQGPAKSNLAELAAQDQTKQGLGQVQEQRGMQSQLFQAEQARQKEQEQQQLEQLDADELNQREELLNRGEEIMQEWRNQGTQLDLKKKAAQTEQLGFIARLSDDAYVNNLKREGRKARLNNKLKFQEELQKAIFDDERELFESDLSFKQAMKQDAREFKELLANEGLDWKKALQVAEMKSQATQQTWTGIGQLGQAGMQGYGQYAANERAGNEAYVDYYNKTATAGKTPLPRQAWETRNENIAEYGSPYAPPTNKGT